MRQPGIEPGSTAWKAAMLTTIPLTLVVEEWREKLKVMKAKCKYHPVCTAPKMRNDSD